MILRAVFVLCLSGLALSRDFPDISTLNFYSTEVQLSLVKEKATVYVYEYYDQLNKRGSVSILDQGAIQSVYYDNETNEILDVNKTYCKATEVDISDFTYTPLYHGWLSTNPLIIGPSALFRYALNNKDKLVDAGTETVRNIPCDKWELKVEDKIDRFKIQFYFAPEGWTTPYKAKKFTPIRIRIVGESTRYSADKNIFSSVDQMSDFAYFKEAIDDKNVLQPPIGIGCILRDKSDLMPSIPEKFKFSAQIVDVLNINKHDDMEVQFERVWFDYPVRLARIDRYEKQTGYKSALYDFRAGAVYNRLNDGSCQMSALKDSELIMYDLGMTGRMKTPMEYLMLDGNFYAMGKREVRGIKCDTFESVITDTYVFGKHFEKFVITVYFIETITRVGVEGETESQIPVLIIANGWSSPTEKSVSVEYSIYGFDDVAWPTMYSSFGLEKCYVKPESKTPFIVVMEVGAKDAAKMEEQDQFIIMQLRSTLAKYAKVPEHRIPFLKADYKSTGVFVSGVLLERPPALLQFFAMDDYPVSTVTRDPDLKLSPDAETLEQCSYACVDEGEFPCKGFFFCNRACFLRSVDPFEDEEGVKETDLGLCYEYIRMERESRTFRESYLDAALESLENAILNETVKIVFEVPSMEEVVTVRDIVLGDGPYIGVDAGDKPFNVAVELRKLDAGLETTQTYLYAQTLTDCYKQCKEAGSACSSFSFCPDAPDDKECMFTSELTIRGVTPDTNFVSDKNCNIYNPKYLEYYMLYPGKISLLSGEKSVRSVTSLEKCAETCRKEKDFVCRGFEYCRSMKTCILHKKHILDLKAGEVGSSSDNKCVHYAARYAADYANMGAVLIEDVSDVRSQTTLDECAQICSEELKEDCKSFNYCPSVDYSTSTCSLSKKLLRDDGVTTTEKKPCLHYEKRSVVHDWDKAKTQVLSKSGYTKKGFTGLVVGMLALGLIIGALGFVLYSYIRSKSSDEGMAVRFMKNET